MSRRAAFSTSSNASLDGFDHKEQAMYAVAGVSGHVGSVVAETLLARGHKVRVIVRDAKKAEGWRAKGAEIAVTDLDDVAGLTRALTGVAGAFLLVPPAYDTDDLLARQRVIADAEVAAVKASAVKHVVYLSSVGAQHPDGTGPIRTAHYAEGRLRETSAALTFVRAAYFMENALNNFAMLAQGTYATFNALDYPFPQVATKDIGALAAEALIEGPRGGAREEIVELVGPKDYSEREIAAALSKLVGKELAVVQGPAEAIVPTLTQHGFAPKTAALFAEMIHGAATGRVAFDGKGRRGAGKTEPTEVLKKLLEVASKH